VEPTDENIDMIIEDARKGLYDSFYLNFISFLPEDKLERLASKAVEFNCFDKFAKVFF
jgi:hypothetical protein